MTGIYCIENTKNGRKYIGQSQNIDKRWALHKQLLRSGTHSNAHLQHSWNAYGEDNFSFYVIELCDIESLSEREIFYIEKFDTFNSGFNMTLGGEGTRGFAHTDEYKKKMHDMFSGRVFSEETLQKMSNAKKGKTPKQTEARKAGYAIVSEKLKGRKHSQEHAKNISKAMIGHTPWNKGKKMQPGTSFWIGKHHSDETKEKISKANKGRTRSDEQKLKMSKRIICVENQEVFPSISSAAKKYNVTIGAVSRALRGKSETCAKMHWEYVKGGEQS